MKRAREIPSCSSLINFILLSYYLSFSFGLSSGNNETDRSALLEIKKAITNDPNGFLDSWNDSFHFCNWPGVQCNPTQRVTSLLLKRLGLAGTLSPHIANISFLKFINLDFNSFHGQIPMQLGNLHRLQHLNASGNLIQGVIPVNLTRCSQLRILRLGGNQLQGTIPDQLGSLPELQFLEMEENNLSGNLPDSLGNLSQLVRLAASYNNLVGRIPDSFGRLRKMSSITMGINNLSGEIPPSLYNLSSIRSMTFTYNQLQGSLPDNIGNTLPNLEAFGVSGNNLVGTIPESFCNASHLEDVNMNRNNFLGRIPNCLGNSGRLLWVDMAANNLGHNSTGDFDFLASLTNCTKLHRVGISINNFGGPLPDIVGNLSSTEFQHLLLGVNHITSIPDTLQNLIGLTMIDLPLNLLKGNIPSYIGKLQNLEELTLHGNDLSGVIPNSMGNLTRLVSLDLSANRIEGRIPASLGKCQSLSFIDFSANRLTGEIPAEVMNLSSSLVNMLNLSHNLLGGKLSPELGNLEDLNAIDISFNDLIGEIPDSIGNCKSMEHVFMQGNSFDGMIPPSFGYLKGLMELDLSRNNLTGEIPLELENLKFLQYLNLSFNNLQGEAFVNSSVTTSLDLEGNPKLCGGAAIVGLNLPKCATTQPSSSGYDRSRTRRIGKSIVIIIVPIFASIALLLGMLTLLLLRRIRKKKQQSTTTEDMIAKQFVRISYAGLHKATDGFSANNLIGVGGFGKVYRGKLEEMEKFVAIKVLNLERERAYTSLAAECEALRNVRHRNLVKVLSFCSSIDHQGNEFKALVFEYMENGSLEDWLHNQQQRRQSNNLSLVKRLDIAIDVAFAVHYLHYLCETTIVHCDLKPSNVLLDGDMVGHVGDFGQARLLLEPVSQGNYATTTTSGVKGTVGYVAPEYGMGSEVSTKGDAYSFGVLVLEMFTRKRPTDEMFREGLNLHDFVKDVDSPGKLVSTVDPILLGEEPQDDDERGRRNRGKRMEKIQSCLMAILEVGVGCSIESVGERMNMADAIGKLQSIRDMLHSR
ncbi:unnamed protein product [Linum trigynum]|uniref:non-specific serine/threonine protein kinase n=1 Tax=Linum trigynum TaxID=586398 RepID=A0AAV2E3Q9_9ROSI